MAVSGESALKVTVTIAVLCIVGWKIVRFVKRREHKMPAGIPIPTSVGDAKAQRRFIDSHKPFLQEFPALQSLLAETFKRSEEKCYPQPLNEQTSGLVELTDEQAANKIVLSLERAAFDDFGELLILAGNGMGIGAKKALRSMYERLVTAGYIATNPAEARIFLANTDIEKGKVLNRAIEAAPELVNKDFTPEEIQNLRDKKKAAENKKKVDYCPKCKNPETEEAWTRVNLDAMAKKVDDTLFRLYGVCYLLPTLLTHATPFGLDIRFRNTDAGPDYNTRSESNAHNAVWRGHFLMLWLLQHQDTYFNLGLGQQVNARSSAFSTIWPEE
jgi:uncharacterized protein DUF5677